MQVGLHIHGPIQVIKPDTKINNIVSDRKKYVQGIFRR